MRIPRLLACTTALFVGLVSVSPAAACVDDAECDNGDTCSIPDTCVSGSCVLGGGGDADDDLVCDAELDPTFEFTVTRLVIRRRNSLRSDNSAVKGGGDLLVHGSPGNAFTGVNGISLRVKDQLSAVNPPSEDGVDHTTTWTPAECITKSNGTVSCRTTGTPTFIKLRPNPLAPSLYKFTFKAKAIGDLAGPFFGPVRIVLSRGNARRGDAVFDCQLKLSGLRCREF
jgi:hypothetical protein